MENPDAYLGRLTPIYIFKGLPEETIREVAEQLEVEQVKAGETIFEQGEEGQNFYIINSGQVKVLRQRSKGEQEQVALLVPGDFFGEGALLYGRRRSATLVAAADAELLRLSKEDFDDLLRRFPQIKPNLLLSHESHELFHRHPFHWLGKDEVVYLIGRRHKIVLYQLLVPPLIVGGVIGLAAVWLAVVLEALLIAWVGAALEVLVALWMLWVYIDWANDYHIVTNERLVHLEKIVAIYDSRVEAPLNSIMSVNVQTENTLGRMLDVGDVVVRTFSGPIVMKDVANPNVFKAAIEEYWHRTETHEEEARLQRARHTIRSRLKPAPPTPSPKPPASASPPAGLPPEKPAKTLKQQLVDFFSLRVRFEQDGNVIYRKHWWILLKRVWKPSLALLGVFVLLALGIGYTLVPIAPMVAAAGLALVPLAGWWLYDYVDWHNDIYMVTRDQIFDVAKKPLGAETKKSAPLANILSLRYERPGLLALLLNYGTVIANVAGAEFSFEGVFDPVSVQNDVYRRKEADASRRKAAEEAKRRQEIADWLTQYHVVTEEMEREEDANT